MYEKYPYRDLAVKTDEEDIILGQLLQVILDDIWLLIGIAAAVVGCAAVYCYTAKPIYSADAHVRVEPHDSISQALTQTQTGAAIDRGPSTLATDAEIEIIKSRGVVAPVVQQCKLNFSVTPTTVPLLGAVAARFATPGQPAKPWLRLSSYAWGGEVAEIDSFEVAPEFESKTLTLTAGVAGNYTLTDEQGVLLLRGKVGQTAHGSGVTLRVDKLIARPKTRFSVVRVNDLDAITAFQSAIQVSEQGKQTGVIEIALQGKNPEQIAHIANALAQSYLHQHIMSKQEEASKMLDFLKREAPRFKADLENAETALTEYQRTTGSINASDEAKVYLEGSVTYEQQIAALRLQLAALAHRFTVEHPLVKTARQQLAQLLSEKDSFSNRFRGLPATEVKAVALQRDAKVAEDIYVLLLNRVQELSVQKVGTGGNVRLVDAALRPGSPVKPKKMLILSAAVILGLILGTAAVFLRRNWFRGIEDVERIERAFCLPFYGQVPFSAEQAKLEIAGEKGRGHMWPILACTRPNDLSVESLRSLRTAMQFTLLDAKNHVIVLTSPTPNVGKSFLSINLAVLLAHSGKSVLLIDADLRRGSLDRFFVHSRKTGMSDLLNGQAKLEDVISETPVTGLSLISCGTRLLNPSELLMSPRLRQCFDAVSERYDIVLVDTPPILAVTDAAIIGKLAGATFLAVRSGMHTESEIGETIKRLRVVGVTLQGGIFNGVRTRTRGYGYGYGYSHGVVHEYLNT